MAVITTIIDVFALVEAVMSKAKEIFEMIERVLDRIGEIIKGILLPPPRSSNAPWPRPFPWPWPSWRRSSASTVPWIP